MRPTEFSKLQAAPPKMFLDALVVSAKAQKFSREAKAHGYLYLVILPIFDPPSPGKRLRPSEERDGPGGSEPAPLAAVKFHPHPDVTRTTHRCPHERCHQRYAANALISHPRKTLSDPAA